MPDTKDKKTPWYAYVAGAVAVVVLAPIALDCAGEIFDAVTDSMTLGMPHD